MNFQRWRSELGKIKKPHCALSKLKTQKQLMRIQIEVF